MHKYSLVPLQQLPELLWLEFILVRRLDAVGIDDWHMRCMRHLTSLRLQAVVSTNCIVATGDGRLITAGERSEVILWLLAQPEVVASEVRIGVPLCRCGDAGEAAPRA